MLTLIEAINKQKNSEQWSKDGGKYIPHPATWLKGERWNDELTAAVSVKKQSSLDVSSFDDALANYVPSYKKGGAV